MTIKKGTVTIAGEVPAAEWGSIEGTLSDQTDLQNALNAKAPKLSPAFTGIPTVPLAEEGTDTNQIASTKFVNTAIDNALENIDVLPDQTGQSGKYLTTNGSNASWANVDALPDQTGQSGKVLTTNGTTASWTEYSPSPETDNETINLNSSDELQAIGTIEKNAGNVKYDWVGTYAEWQTGRANETIPDSWICYITDDYTSSTVTHNIGDVFYSLRNENMMNGAVVCDGSEYNITDYSSGGNSLKSLLDNGNLPYISIADFDAAVTANGSCRCFGYDSGSTFKVPKLNDVFIEAGAASTVSEFIEAGLPNITGATRGPLTNADGTTLSNGVFSDSYVPDGQEKIFGYRNDSQHNVFRLDFKASNSNPIYGNSDTVQPNSVKYKAYIQLANGTTESALQTVSSVVNDVETLKDEIEETLKYKNITNCITEIPQDIKLELSERTLALKAGSKVYIPNGFEQDGTTPHFDEIIITNDVTRTEESITDRQYFTCYKNDYIFMAYVSGTFSGPTQPTVTGTTAYWYDTTNNLIKRTNDSGATWTSGYSLPYGLVTVSSGSISSIDQIFNGFGFIGSTFFVLPGVKGLAPNGRNNDGSLKNLSITTTNVSVETIDNNNENIYGTMYLTNSGGIAWWFNWDDYISETLPSGTYNHVYIPSKNEFWYNNDGNYWQCWDVKVCTYHSENGVIKSMDVPLAFRAINYNDKKEISTWSMPSTKYIDLNLQSSGSTYTAPANGWYAVGITWSNNSSHYCFLRNTDNGCGTSFQFNNASTVLHSLIAPVTKGQTVVLDYVATINYFRFIYAEGEV